MDCTFIQSAVQFMPLIHPFTHTFTHQRRLAAMRGANQLVRSNWGLGVLLMDTSTRPGWDRTGNTSTARRQLLPPEPYRPLYVDTGPQKGGGWVTTVRLLFLICSKITQGSLPIFGPGLIIHSYSPLYIHLHSCVCHYIALHYRHLADALIQSDIH